MVEKEQEGSRWFLRDQEGILTPTTEKKEAPEGLWYQCPECKTTVTFHEHKDTFWVCISCDYHERISAAEYFELIYDDNKWAEMFDDLEPTDFLEFSDLKSYSDRIVSTQKKTGLKDSMRVAVGVVHGEKLVTAAMDFEFIGGSMGSVMGEKISLASDFCIKNKLPLMIISKSGGARMMESAFSLMQMAKTSAKLTMLAKHKLPFISLVTDPTTGGVTASFAMLGDINIAEPKALIAFAGPRVIRETIKRDLPEGFQRSEFLLEHGFLDFIVHRKDLKERLHDTLVIFKN